jgi:hypothetical protein
MGKFVDLTGQKFGRLTVIKRAENNKWRDSQWLCKCDCNGENSEKIITGRSLKNGYTQSCGCLQKEKTSELLKKYNTYNLTGEYGIGYTSSGEEFYFDLEDYDKIKDYCWCLNNNYIITNSYIDNSVIYMHRLVMNCPDDMEVDHIFHDTWDNRKNKLRIVTISQNSMNAVLFSNNTSGVKGVNWEKRKEKWQARISINGKRIYLGSFDNFENAVKVRKEAELKYYGEYRYKEKGLNT